MIAVLKKENTTCSVSPSEQPRPRSPFDASLASLASLAGSLLATVFP